MAAYGKMDFSAFHCTAVTFQYFKVKGYCLTVVGLTCTITSLLIMTEWHAIGSDPCTEHSLFHHPQLADQYRLELAESNISQSGIVSVQSLQVVEGEVYQMAVNRCESAGEHCHWIATQLPSDWHKVGTKLFHDLSLSLMFTNL